MSSSTIILVTGANQGVGLEIVRAAVAASKDYHVIMAGRSLEKLADAMTQLKTSEAKGELSILQLDITNQASVESAASIVAEKFGRLDVLVNNAGVMSKNPDLRTRIRENFETNVGGSAAVSEAFRPLLFKSQNPRTIYVTSSLGSMYETVGPDSHYSQNVVPIFDAYSASKAALNMMMVYESKEYGPKGLKVWVVCPGYVVSNLRGKNEDDRNGGGYAGDPRVSGQTILSVIQGKRDADVGRFVHKDGLYQW